MSDRDPLRITRIEVRNLRAIDVLSIELDPGVSEEAGALVIAAANGRGKTSVIEGVLLALGRDDLLPIDHAPFGEWVRQGASRFEVKVTTAQGGRSTCASVAGDVHGEVRREVGSVDDEGFFVPLASLPSKPEGIELFSARREPEDLGMIASGDGRRSTREERRLHELKRRIVNILSKKNRPEIFRRISEFYQSFEGDEWSLDVVFASDDAGADAIPVMVRGGIPAGENGEPLTWDRVVRGEASGSTIVPLDRLSSGQMAILAMAYPFVFGAALHIALIDEPEQHLHPMFQRALLPALRALSPRTQFIVATHSPYVLDSVPTYERLRLSVDDPAIGSEAAQ